MGKKCDIVSMSYQDLALGTEQIFMAHDLKVLQTWASAKHKLHLTLSRQMGELSSPLWPYMEKQVR